MYTWLPTQIGWIPTGVNGTVKTSTFIIGRIVSGSYPANFEGVGFGLGGRPDYTEVIKINIVDRASDGTLTQKATITINADDIIAIAGAPANLALKLTEVDVCDNGTAKKNDYSGESDLFGLEKDKILFKKARRRLQGSQLAILVPDILSTALAIGCATMAIASPRPNFR